MADRPIIWQFWQPPEGQDYVPGWLLECLKTVHIQASHDFNVQLLDEAKAQELLPRVGKFIAGVRDLNEQHGPNSARALGIRTGFYRAFLLQKFGGVWLDADSILFRSPLHEYETIRRPGFAAGRLYIRDEIRVSNGVLMAWPGSPFLEEYCNRLRERLKAGKRQRWGGPGIYTLGPLSREMPDDIHLFRSTVFHPVLASQRKVFQKPVPLLDWVHPETVGCMLYNSGMQRFDRYTSDGKMTLLERMLLHGMDYPEEVVHAE